jgi:hypothetical protein
MAVDSIIASPTNKVRVIVADASGCCARALKAVDTARPSPRAGHMHPTPVVSPAVTIEAAAINVMLSKVSPLAVSCRSDIHRGKNGKNIGLHHTGEQAEHRHDDGKYERCDGE